MKKSFYKLESISRSTKLAKSEDIPLVPKNVWKDSLKMNIFFIVRKFMKL